VIHALVQSELNAESGVRNTESFGHPHATKFFERAIFLFNDLSKMVLTRGIRDAMTMIAVLHAAFAR
jgi:hypothetical protein